MAQVTTPIKAKQQIVLKPEATYGVDIFAGTYTAADVVPAIADTIRCSPNVEEFLNLATLGNRGRLPSAIGLRTCTVTWDTQLRGREAVYTSLIFPEVHVPLRGSGLGAVLTAAEWVYTPSDTHESMTCYVVQDVPGGNAVAVKILGAHLTWKIAGAAGGPMRITFTLQGVLSAMADLTYVPGTMAPTPGYPTLKSALFQIGSTNYAPRIANISFDLGGTLRRVPDINSASGLVGFMIADREPLIEIDAEADREATSGWWGALDDGSPLHDLSFQLGGPANNIFKFRFRSDLTSGIQVVGLELGERDGIACFNLKLRPTLSTTPNTDFQIIAAAA
jgi:hypothetical protein